MLVFSVIFSVEMSRLVVKPLERIMTVIYQSMAGFGRDVVMSADDEEVRANRSIPYPPSRCCLPQLCACAFRKT